MNETDRIVEGNGLGHVASCFVSSLALSTSQSNAAIGWELWPMFSRQRPF